MKWKRAFQLKLPTPQSNITQQSKSSYSHEQLKQRDSEQAGPKVMILDALCIKMSAKAGVMVITRGRLNKGEGV